AYYKVALTWNLLMAPILILATTTLAMAVGMWMSAMNVQYRDIKHALPFFVQLWMFATPIIYPTDLVPTQWRWVLALNPMAPMIEGYRASLFGRPFHWGSLAFAGALTIASLVYAAYVFKRMEKDFADVV